ncbi:MAG: hypothetical protein RIR05_361 [Bacteroidota bacterium]|jgi:Bacteriodetes cell division protein (FtsL-like)|nr:hypothetical protein [Sphingobacteriia bacterium]
MSPNTFKTPISESQEQELHEIKGAPSEKSAGQVPQGFIARWISKIFSGTFLENEKYLTYLPFIIFLFALGLLYIANGYYADDKIREYNRLNRELNELRTSYITHKSELMFMGKQSEVAKQAETMGLKTTASPPYKIELDSNCFVPFSYHE